MKKQLFNPYLPMGEYIPDGEPHIFEDRLYIYGSHDRADGHRFCEEDYTVWSAPIDDLSDWECGGASYKRDSDPHNPAGEHALFAPDAARGHDGRYYLFYCLDFLGEFGVAVSSRPGGPFEFYGHVHKPDGTVFKEYFPYDPSVFVDNDGKVYLYYGFCPAFKNGSFGEITPSPGCMVIRLEQDMLTVKGKPKMCLPGYTCCEGTAFPKEHSYFEAPSMRKIGDLYYLTYSSQSQHELCYAVSKYPDKDFDYRGVIISNGDIGYQGRKDPVNYTGTNHGGMVEIGGHWYIFYHRNTHAVACSRQGCAEKISIDKKGNISQAEVTSQGLRGKPLNGTGEYPAGIACCLQKGGTAFAMKYGEDHKDTEPYIYQEGSGAAAEHYIANITDRVSWGLRYFRLKRNGKIGVELRGNGEGKILVYSDIDKKTRIAEIKVSLEESDSFCWRWAEAPRSEYTGVSELYFEFRGEGKLACRRIRLS